MAFSWQYVKETGWGCESLSNRNLIASFHTWWRCLSAWTYSNIQAVQLGLLAGKELFFTAANLRPFHELWRKISNGFFTSKCPMIFTLTPSGKQIFDDQTERFYVVNKFSTCTLNHRQTVSHFIACYWHKLILETSR